MGERLRTYEARCQRCDAPFNGSNPECLRCIRAVARRDALIEAADKLTADGCVSIQGQGLLRRMAEEAPK